MKEDQQRFLSLLGQLPTRLTAEQAGWMLNCQSHDIPALVNARLLKPLGKPRNSHPQWLAPARSPCSIICLSCGCQDCADRTRRFARGFSFVPPS